MTFTTSEPPFIFRAGTRPLLISMPHVGTHVPAEIAATFTEAARRVPDTDWHLERLYDFADEIGASVLVATHSRYVTDLNRPPDNENLYPGQDTTGLCPADTFDREPIYLRGEDAPDQEGLGQRRAAIWQPYHDKLQAELSRLRAVHGHAALWDAHSIRSVVPRFFEGRLPDLNFGTAGGASCDPALAEALLAVAKGSSYTAVLDGRFKGGYITRHYGRPASGIHAVQLEMAQCIYMDETYPFAYREERAREVQPLLRRLLETILEFIEGRTDSP